MTSRTGTDGGSIPPLDEAHFRPAIPVVRRPATIAWLLGLDALMIVGLGFVLFAAAISGLSGGIGHPSPQDDSVSLLWSAIVLLIAHLVLWVGLLRGVRWVWLTHLVVTGALMMGTWIRPLGRDWPAAIPFVLGSLTLVLLLLPATRKGYGAR